MARTGKLKATMMMSFSLSALVAGFSSSAAAQDAPTVAESASSSGEQAADAEETYLDDITVTGQRITDKDASVGVLNNLPVKDSPVSIRAISNDLIENVFARNVTDTVKTDASISSSSTAGAYADFIQVRGFPSGTLVDGVFVGSTDQPFPIDTLERVEILKGVSTFLTGAAPSTGTSGPGGTINLVTKRAPAEFGGSVKAEFSERSHFRGILDVGQSFDMGGGTLGARFIGSHEDGDRSIDRNSDKRSMAYLALDWKPIDNLTLNSDALYLTVRNLGYQDVVIVEPGFDIPDAPDGNNNLKPWSSWKPETMILKTRAIWSFSSEWKLTGTLGYSDTSTTYITPSYPTIVNPEGDFISTAIYSGGFSSKTFTVDVKVNGKFTTGPINHKIGFGYNRTRGKRSQFYYEYLEPYDGLIPAIGSNIFAPSFPSNEIPDFVARNGEAAVDTKSVQSSFFVNTIMSILDDRLSFLAGVRRVSFNDTFFEYECTPEPVTDSSFCRPGSISSSPVKTSKWTPSFSLFGKPTEQILVYASYSKQLEQGGQATAQFANANENLPPITSVQYEIGAKLNLADASITLAAFDIDRGLQFVDPVTNIFGNFGSQVNRGIEGVVEGKIAEGLVANFGITYIDATFRETGDPAINGNTMTGVPKWTATLFADYAISSLPGFAINSTLIYGSSQYYDLDNSRRIPSFFTMDIGARYTFDIGKKAVTLNAYISNIFDESYWATASGDGFQALGNGQARTLNLGLSFDF